MNIYFVTSNKLDVTFFIRSPDVPRRNVVFSFHNFRLHIDQGYYWGVDETAADLLAFVHTCYDFSLTVRLVEPSII